MFLITPVDVNDVMFALGMLASYNVLVNIEAINEESTKPTNYTFVVKAPPDADEDDDLRLAEMAFQMAFRQKPHSACAICKAEGKEFCGHLTFTSKINR